MANKPTLTGWLTRDASIAAILALTCYGLTRWHAIADNLFTNVISHIVGFVATYVVCYIVHEWGHLIGAKATGSNMPFASYKSPLIGFFDASKHSTKQFLALSWGGVIGYTLVCGLALTLFFNFKNPVTGGMAIGGLAFVCQSWLVDLPQIFHVRKGADPVATNRKGASKEMILKRTWQAWIVLAAALLTYNIA